jgi:sarcosine oxidase subunit alpha
MSIARTKSPIAVTPVLGRMKELGADLVVEGEWRVAESISAVDEEVERARRAVGLVDESARGKLLIQGMAAEALVTAAFGMAAPAIERGATLTGMGAALYRLRHDLFLASTPPGGEKTVTGLLEGVSQDGFVTVTDITHGRSEFRLIGPRAAMVMSKVCGLDFHPSRFADGTARQTSVAKTRQLVVRRDAGSQNAGIGARLPAYAMLGGRASGRYFWDVLLEAGAEFDIAPIGQESVRGLDE